MKLLPELQWLRPEPEYSKEDIETKQVTTIVLNTEELHRVTEESPWDSA